MNTTIVDVLIENIKTDQDLLNDIELKIEEEKEAKREITDRLKGYRKDLSVLLKYTDEKQRQKIEDLGFELSEQSNGLNPVAQLVFDIILKTKNNQMENGKLYDAYQKACKAKNQEPVNYTQFNIKCRSLFNTQRLLRKKGKDPKDSRSDLITLNGQRGNPAVKQKLDTSPQNNKKDGK